MSGLAKVLSIAQVGLLRQVRDRSSAFFVFVLPTIIVFALGLQFGGGGQARIGVVVPAGDALAQELVTALEAAETGFDVRLTNDPVGLRDDVERGFVELGLIVTDGFGAALAAGTPATVEILGTAEAATTGVRATVEAALGRQAAIALAARIAADRGAGPWTAAQTTAAGAYDDVPGVDVTVTIAGEPSPFAGVGQFEFGAQTQLVLFMFLTSMTAATSLVLSKKLGVSRRMLSTPTAATTIVAGEALGRLAIALLQGVYIVGVSAIVFGVRWGDPVAATLLVLSFALVCAAAAMVVGAISRNADQAGAFGVMAGLALGALGGAMVPASFMPPFMLTIAQAIPHFWAIDGLGRLAKGADLATIGLDVAVLAVYGTALMLFAAWRFRKSITG